MKSEDTQIESGSFADVAGACLCRLKYAPHAPDPKDSWYLLFKGLHKLEKGKFKDEWEKHPVTPPHPASKPIVCVCALRRSYTAHAQQQVEKKQVQWGKENRFSEFYTTVSMEGYRYSGHVNKVRTLRAYSRP